MTFRTVLLLLSLACLILPSTALTGMVTREVIAAGDGVYQVTLHLSQLPVCGIVETLPSDATVENTSLPDAQVRIQDHKIALVVVNDTSVQYTLWSDTAQGIEIEGVWEDFLRGEQGYVQDRSNQPGPVPTTTTPEIAPTPSAGFAGILPAGAMLIGALLLLWYRREHP